MADTQTGRGSLIVVSGFAGTGKGTVVKKLLADHEEYALSVSMTTRAPREGEQEGVAYFFVSQEEFDRTIEEGGFIEYARYVGHSYGTPRAYVEKMLSAGRDVLLEIEIQGAMNVKKLFPEAVLIFIMPPGAEELKKRLVGRGTETMEVVEQRMKRAAEEAEIIGKYDYMVVNDEVENCAGRIHAIVTADHARPGRHEAFIRRVQEQLRNITV